jgi:hypothetical protein
LSSCAETDAENSAATRKHRARFTAPN